VKLGAAVVEVVVVDVGATVEEVVLPVAGTVVVTRGGWRSVVERFFSGAEEGRSTAAATAPARTSTTSPIHSRARRVRSAAVSNTNSW
jgi:hypothetical protein